MNNNFNYPIFPDRTYTLTYEGYTYKVTGEHILAMFHREAAMDRFIKELSVDNHVDNSDTYLDIGEL